MNGDLDRPRFSLGRAAWRRAVLVAALALLSAPASAHRGHSFGSPFHDVFLEEGCKLAEQEFKLVCVYVTGPKGDVPRYLKRPSWSEWRAIDLLILETVALRLDGGRDAPQLDRYELDKLPAMLLLNPDGSQRRRLAGDLSVEQLCRELAADLGGDDSVARVRKAVRAGNGVDPLARERLAQTLIRRGSLDQALTEYLWCVEVGLRRSLPYATARRRLLFKGFVALGERHPPAREALDKLRQGMEQSLLHERDDANLARDLAELNRCLGEQARSLAFFDKLPPRSRARYVLFDRVFDQLIEHRRYDEVLALADPLRTFRQEVQMARQRSILWEEDPQAHAERGTRAFAVARGAALVEALAGSKRGQEAQTLIDKILRFDDRPQTRDLLKHHAQRAGNQELITYVQSRPTKGVNNPKP